MVGLLVLRRGGCDGVGGGVSWSVWV
jgi:hypothetical protein